MDNNLNHLGPRENYAAPVSFKVRDSGQRQTFDTGSVRDLPDGKPRFGLLPWYVLNRWADHMGKGAVKYKDNNWRRGQPLSRYFESAIRHLYNWAEGDTTEDHLAAALFNVGGLMWTEAAIAAGKLPAKLSDMLGLLDPPQD